MRREAIYLAQTDTTAGLLSSDSRRLAQLKGRAESKPMLLALPSLRALKEHVRVPLAFRNRVRRSHQSSFIYPNGQGARVVREGMHARFLQKFGALYSTSANLSGHAFSLDFAREVSEVQVVDSRGIYEGKASSIWRLGRTKQQRVRR